MAEYFVAQPEALTGKAAVVSLAPMETVLGLIYARRLASKNLMRIFSTWEAACAFVGAGELPDPFGDLTDDLERRHHHLARPR